MDTNQFWTDYDPKTYRQNMRCLSVNTILAGKYLVGPVLGQGGFGITYQGYDLNMETRIAIKEYFPVELVSRDTTTMHGDHVLSLSGEKSVTYQQGLKKYVAEAQNVSQFSDIPGIVSVKDFFYENDTAYIVMEYIEGESLKDYLKEQGGRLSEEETLRIMKPVLEALVQVHKAGIIHRDISPDNIMLTFEEEAAGKTGSNEIQNADGSDAGNALDSGRQIKDVKLIDFGAARMTAKNDQKSLTIILKHGYAPEEQYRTHGEQGPWTDVYAVCATMYRMVTGETPVPAMDRLFQDELKKPSDLGVKLNASTEAAILKGLAVKKDDRIRTMQELIGALYEGKTAKRSGSSRKEKNGAGTEANSRRFLMAGVGAAVLALAVTAGAAGMRNHKKDLSAAETEPAATAGLIVEERKTIEESESTETGSELQVVNLDPQEEEKEQIVFPDAEHMIAAGSRHFLSLREDGSVWPIGNNAYGQCEVTEWDHIARVYACGNISAGLREDGTVAAAGYLKDADVDSWTGIADLACGVSHLIGLKEDGTVVSAGYNSKGQCDVSEWTEIEKIFAFREVSIGITESGEIKIAGTVQGLEGVLERVKEWKNMESVTFGEFDQGVVFGVRKDETVCYETDSEYFNKELSYLKELKGAAQVINADGIAVRFQDGSVMRRRWEESGTWTDVEWDHIVAVTGNTWELLGLRSDGTLAVPPSEWEGDRTPNELLSIQDARMAAWGENHLSILREDGTVVSSGGIGVGVEDACATGEWSDIISIDAYDRGTAGLTKDRRVVQTGHSSIVSPQQENITDIFTIASQLDAKVADWTMNQQIVCSNDAVAARKEDGTVTAMGHTDDFQYTDYRTGKMKDGTTDVEGWSDVVQVAASKKGIIGLKSDGTVVTTGKILTKTGAVVAEPGTLPEWEDLDDIVSIWGNRDAAAAIRKDGTVVYLVEGNEANGQNNVSGWENMVQLSVGEYHTVGLRKDGTVAAVGSNTNGQCEVEDWENIVSVAAGPSATIGITADGKILMAGVFPNDYEVMEQWPAVPVPEQ